MELDKVLFQQLIKDAGLAAMLAPFGDRPAVFYQRAEPPSHPKWTGKQFPRIDYTLDYQGDPQRQTSGRMTLNIYCDKDFGAESEAIEAYLRKMLHASFAQTDDYPYCFAWVRSDAFELNGESDQETRTTGFTMLFDLIAFPVDRTDSPDVVWSVMEWIKARYPAMTVIGIDQSDQTWKPTNETPVCYVRMEGMVTPVKPTNVCVWLSTNIVIHVICSGQQRQQTWNKRLVDALSIEGEVVLDDGSPFFVHRMSVKPTTNAITSGQIVVNGEYGVLRKPEPTEPLRHVNFSREKEG